MNIGPVFWIIMTVGGALLLGLGLAYGLAVTRKRRENPVAQRLTDEATRQLYEQEEDARRQRDAEPRVHRANITKTRQGITGHNVSLVLVTSVTLAVLTGAGLFAYLWLTRG
jgi:Flp pilus assembly protein TadB